MNISINNNLNNNKNERKDMDMNQTTNNQKEIKNRRSSIMNQIMHIVEKGTKDDYAKEVIVKNLKDLDPAKIYAGDLLQIWNYIGDEEYDDDWMKMMWNRLDVPELADWCRASKKTMEIQVPDAVYRLRSLAQFTNEPTIAEMTIRRKPNEDKPGWTITFNSWTLIRKSGKVFKRQWPGVVYINETPKGVRILIVDKDKNKARYELSIHDLVRAKLIPNTTLNGFFQQEILAWMENNIKPEDILPIMKYLDGGFEFVYHSNMILYPYNISRSLIYWIGEETSIKKILNRAYGHPHGVTKNIFNGINNINTKQRLQNAITLVRMFKWMTPQELEKIPATVLDNKFETIPTFHASEAAENINTFVAKFGIKPSYFEGFINEKFTFSGESKGIQFDNTTMHLVRDTNDTLKQIQSRNMKNAIVNHVRRRKMTIQEIHDFVVEESNKIRYENKPIKLKGTYKVLNNWNNKQIADDVYLVVPEDTHTLVHWGTVQNNCIGTYSDRVAHNDSIIVGFRKEDGDWWGHAEIDPQRNTVRQLLGKYNASLPVEQKNAILDFLKKQLEVTVNNIWA